MQDFETRLAALESRPVADASLAARVSALEAQPQTAPETAPQAQDFEADLAAALAPLTGDLSGLSQRLAALESRPAAPLGGAGDGLSPAQLDLLRNELSQSLAAKVAAAEASLSAAQDEAKKLEASANATATKITQRAALGQIRVALDGGQAFGGALQDLGVSDLPAILSQSAASGIPSLADLAQSFPAAARSALEASLKADMGESWGQRFTSFLQTTSGARSLAPREGGDPDAVLSRAEAAVGSGDLDQALQEITALPPEGQAKMAPWVERAQLRKDALAALAALAARLGE